MVSHSQMVVRQRIKKTKAIPKGAATDIAKDILKSRIKARAGLPIRHHKHRIPEDVRDLLSRAKKHLFSRAKKHRIPEDVRDLFFKAEKSELRNSFDDYISAQDAVVEKVVPGDLCPNRSLKKAADHVRNSIGAVVDWFVRLSDLQYSLNGEFCFSDWGITHSGFLKGKVKLMDKLLKCSKARTKKDMKALGHKIELIFRNAPASPPDVADLIKLLKEYNPALKGLLQIHVCRENGTRKEVVFTKMFDRRLLSVKDDKKNTYTNIVNQLPSNNWVHQAMTNVHLHNLLRFHFGVATETLEEKITAFLSNVMRCDPTCEGLLQFRRNGGAHLVQNYSFDPHDGLEEALEGAAAAGAQLVPCFSSIISAQLPAAAPQPVLTGIEREFLSFLTREEAKHVAVSICQIGIGVFRHSRAGAKAAAKAAAEERIRHQIDSQYASRQARKQALAEGNNERHRLAASNLPDPPLAKRKMFDEENVSDMMEIVEPNLLHEFQKVMFNARQLVNLNLRDESTAVCLRKL